MARYPAAVWQPVTRYQPGVSGSIATRMAAHRRYGLHTAVSSAESLFSWFNVAGRATSHFYVSASGRVYQYIDTAYRSSAHLEGNPDTITVESEDMGSPFPSWSGSNVPAWTSQQVEALAKLGAWCHKTHGIKLVLCPNSKPGSLGFAWHRQGIDPWRVSGGEYWSKSTGKVCPGDRRVAQVPTILARAKVLAGTPTTPEDDHMSAADVAELKKYIDAKVPEMARAVHERSVQVGLDTEPLGLAVGRTRAGARRIEATQLDVASLAAQLAPLLPSGQVATQEQLEAALRNVLGSLDE